MIAGRAGRWRWILVATLSVASVPHAGAQERGGLAGHVLDRGTQRPIPGASVAIARTRLTVTTDEAGWFAFPDLPPGPVSLRIEFSGYLSQVEGAEIPAGDVAVVELRIQPMIAALQGLLVVRDRPDDRALAAETVISVEPEERTMTVAEVLRRRVPGLTLSPGSGAVGARGRLRFSGSSSLTLSTEPLVFMDGVVVSRPDGGGSDGAFWLLNGMSASQVARIRILRGPAAAAKYGESANGVILIETRSGPG